MERSAAGRPTRPNSFGRLGRAATALSALAAGLASSAAAQPAPPSLNAFVEIADVSAVAASPDGRRVAFRIDRPSIERNSYRLAWHVIDLVTGEQKEIASAGEPIVNDPGLLAAETPIWSPDGRWIYYRALRSGAVQIWRSAADGSRSEAVTAEAGDVLSLERTADARGLAYRVGPPRGEIEQAELAEYEEGILVDEHVELGQNVFRGAIVNGRRATQRLNGPWFNRSHVLWARPPLDRRLDFGTLRVSQAGAANFPAPPPPLEGGRTPDAYARSSRGDLAAASWNWTEGSLVVIRQDGTRIACPIEQCRTERTSWVAWRPDRDEVVFATADRARVQTLRLWNLAIGQVRSLPRMNGQISGGPEESTPCAILEARAVCVLAEPVSPPRLEGIDLGSGAARPLFDPNASDRAYRWPRAERLTWRSPAGHIFTGILFLPEAAPPRPLPLFVNYYSCGGFIRGGVGDEWPFALLATSGIASVCINATRADPPNGVEAYRAALGGVETLVDILANRGLADRSRVGMGGLSFGTEVTLWTLIHSDLLAAASIASPQLEASSYWINSVRGREYPRILREVWGLGPPDQTPEQWQLISAARNVDRIRAPLLLQLAEQESRYATELYARLSNSPTPTEMYVFPEEPHIKVQPRHRLAVYRRNLDWFRFWLQGHVDPEPSKAEQYRRWRALRERLGATQSRHEVSQSEIETRSNRR